MILVGLAVAAAALAVGHSGRATRALVWWRAERGAAPVLARPAVVQVVGIVERIEPMPPRDLVRLRIATDAATGLPGLVRVNLAVKDMPDGLTPGPRVRARLMPPAPPAVPGADDFERVARFDGLDATGRGFAPVEVLAPGRRDSGLRARLTALCVRSPPNSLPMLWPDAKQAAQ